MISLQKINLERITGEQIAWSVFALATACYIYKVKTDKPWHVRGGPKQRKDIEKRDEKRIN